MEPLVVFSAFIIVVIIFTIYSALDNRDRTIKRYKSELQQLNNQLIQSIASKKLATTELAKTQARVDEITKMYNSLAPQVVDARRRAQEEIETQRQTQEIEIRHKTQELEAQREAQEEKAWHETQEIRERCRAQVAEAQHETQKTKEDQRGLEDLNRNVLERIKKESALLPSVIEWLDRIQEMMDARNSGYLLYKKTPAPKAHQAVTEANAETRNWKRRAIAWRNHAILYEAQAPWIANSLDYTVEEVLEGLQALQQEQGDFAQHDDPVEKYLIAAEWKALTPAQRNQLALDRYFESRQKSAWLAGIAYERFIGHSYEVDGYTVEYQGAIMGVNDLGVDLVCQRDSVTHLIQCKRLSEIKARPVRENAIAQLHGATLVFAHTKNIPIDKITPIIITTYQLSDEAKRFASILGIKYQEQVLFAKYPSIKCNVSRSGERIYHLPFDQQYDVTKVVPSDGDCWALTVAEAEAKKFRRAFRWHGS